MKTIGILTILLSFIGLIATDKDADSVYQFELKDIDGQKVHLDTYQGKVLLIVNTASECGYTPQYEGLQALYEKYQEDGLVILGFPANNFGGQEPGTNEEIKQFCSVNFNVTFPMFSKISVKGNNIDPLFTYLTTEDNPDFTGEIKWNFEKFLIDRNGKLIRRFRSATEPLSDDILNAVVDAL